MKPITAEMARELRALTHTARGVMPMFGKHTVGNQSFQSGTTNGLQERGLINITNLEDGWTNSALFSINPLGMVALAEWEAKHGDNAKG